MSDKTTPILTRDDLNRKLWGAADILRGTVDAGDFKNHIFALMFLKRISDVFDERREEIIQEWIAQGKSREDAEEIARDPDEYGRGSFFVPAGAHWSDLMKVGENRAEAIDKALHAIEEQNGQYLEGVLAGVHFNDPRRFGSPQEMDGLMQRLLTHFSTIPLGNRNLAEPDVLGNAYEYLIERFAEGSGKKGGEFYTPRMVVKLIAELLRPQEGMRIHDPTSGSGGMLIECGHFVDDHGGNARNITLTAQEKNMGTWAICKLNMLLHNFPDADIRGGDTIQNPKFTEAGVLMTFDRVIANPPFSLKDWGHDAVTPDPKDRSRKGDPYRRFHRGIPPRTKGDMAFLQHMIEVCNDRGMVGVVMPHGVLFRGGAEQRIRKAMIEEDLFEAVIGLPEKLFFGAGIPATVLVLNKAKPKERKGKVLFIDAAHEGFYHKGKNRNVLRFLDILRVVAVYRAFAKSGEVSAMMERLADEWRKAAEGHRSRQLKRAAHAAEDVRERINKEAERRIAEINAAQESARQWLKQKNPGGRASLDKLAAVVALEQIAGEHDHNLNISRYVDPYDPPPQLDVRDELKKLRELEKKRDEAETRMNKLLAEMGYHV